LERIRTYFIGEDVNHVWISEKVNLDEGDNFLCSMVKEDLGEIWRCWEYLVGESHVILHNTIIYGE